MPGGNTEISRVRRSGEEAKIFYDKISKWYDLIGTSFEKKCGYLGIKKLDVREGDVALEIGFGTGYFIIALARLVGRRCRVYGIDISKGMYEIARLRVEKAGLLNRVKLKCGDAAVTPFQSDFFDKIFLSFTLELFDTPEIPVILGECNRVLRSGGRICVVSLLKKKKVSVGLYEWLHRKFPNFIDCRPIFARIALEGASFSVVDTIETSMWGLPVEIVLAEKVANSS